MNIYEKMSAVSNEISRVPKNLIVGTGKNQYRAVSEADILKAVKDAETKFRVFSYPLSHEIVESKAIINETEYGKREIQFVRVKAVYRFVDIDAPESFVDVIAFGDGVDSLDKAPGKAVTYADKYAMMKGYKVETGDDTDRSVSDDLSGHDIFKIKQRIEMTMTEKIKTGKSESDIFNAIGITKKQYEILFGYFNSIASFESKLKKI